MWESKGVMLTAEELVRRRTKTDPVLPTRGPKCFTPSGSWLESKQLQSLLDSTKALIGEERVERENALAQAEWDENLKVARVTRIVGRQFEKFGHEENTAIFLYPEEAMYLLETNHLQILYGGVSMSIQQAYSVLLGPKTGCTFVEYMVFSHLLKNGFKVLRHCPKRTVTRYERLIGLHTEQPRNRKSRRKLNVPTKLGNNVVDDKNVKIDLKIENKNEINSLFEIDNINLHNLISECNKGREPNASMDDNNATAVNSFDDTVENNFSSGSDIEILSEKSVCRSDESLQYEITDYSSSASEDSDCQVVFSTDVEASGADWRFRSTNKVIEEINLSDSNGSGIDYSNVENSSHIKNEVPIEEIVCHDVESKDSKLFMEELNNPDVVFDSECQNLQVNASKSESNGNDGYVNECSSAHVDHNTECQDLLIKETTEVNISITSNVKGVEKEVSWNEYQNNLSDCDAIVRDIKEESVHCDSTSALLSRESVIQIDSNVPCNEEREAIVLASCQNQKEIEVIDLDDDDNDNSVGGFIEDKNAILLSFPNCAGCHVMHCQVPPERLCPPNVSPISRTYDIVLERLQDPMYGGNPKKNKQKRNEDFHDHTRYHNESYFENSAPRYQSQPNRPYYNRRFMNFPRDYERQWHERPNMFRNESFPDPRMYAEATRHPSFPSCMNQNSMNVFPGSPYQPGCNSTPYQRSRPNLRRRGHTKRRMFQPDVVYRNFCLGINRPHTSNITRTHINRPRRKARGSRSIYPDRYVASREFEDNESSNERDGDFVSFNPNNSENCTVYDQHRRSQDHNMGQKRHHASFEENSSSGSGQKRHRGTRGRYFPLNRRSEDLLQFLGGINSDNAVNTAPKSRNAHTNSQDDLNESRGNSNALAESESGDNSGSGTCSSTSSSSSSNSQESSEESMDEMYDDNVKKNSISVIIKPNELQDIDSCLKSLQVVHSMKFRGLTAVSGEPLLCIKFDIYQPSTPFRRSEPPVPDFRVVVMQPHQNLPTSRQLAFLGQGFDDDVPLLFAIASIDSVAFYLQSVVNLPFVSSKEKVQG